LFKLWCKEQRLFYATISRKIIVKTFSSQQLIYTSKARINLFGSGWSKEQMYRIYSDRIELDMKCVIRKTYVIFSADIMDIWIGRPPAMGELWRGRHAVAGSPLALKLDLADIFTHVVILRNRGYGFPRAFHFTPEDPKVFVETSKTVLDNPSIRSE
jgi:hypothetical protein